MSKSKNIFCTGCNRGLGLTLVKQMLERFKPQHLFATCRNVAAAGELNELAAKYGNLHVVEMDVSNTEKYEEVANYVDEVTGGEGINLLINNAGIMEGTRDSILNLEKSKFLQHLEVNAIGPIFIVKAFLPLLEKAAVKSTAPEGIGKSVVVNMSTKMGSIDDNTSGGSYYYRTSKTALNMATKNLSMELKNKGIVTIMMHPGWVQTDMGGKNAPLTVGESVNGMVDVIEKLTGNDNGKFLQFDGKIVPW